MKFREHMSILWLTIQIFINELQLKWLIWRHHKAEKRTRHCLNELQSEQAFDDNFGEWIDLIRTMNPELPQNVFLGEKK